MYNAEYSDVLLNSSAVLFTVLREWIEFPPDDEHVYCRNIIFKMFFFISEINIKINVVWRYSTFYHYECPKRHELKAKYGSRTVHGKRHINNKNSISIAEITENPIHFVTTSANIW